MRSWKIVNKPFESIYPGDREWNKDSAQLRFIPSTDIDNLVHPTWDLIFDHIGKSLNDGLLKNEWAKINGVTTGKQYLKLWLASVLQKPYEPTPYLFLYGSEDCGKSTLHEAISLLIINGVKRVDTALTSQGSFNAELANAVICITEETDLRKNKTALAKIRDWTTSKSISIHKKGLDPYDIINTCHFIQTSNRDDACPVFPGDSRITVIYVEDIPRDKIISKRELIKQLEKESPDILRTLLSLEIPVYNDRLNLPVIETEAKAKAQESNKTLLELFCEEQCYIVPGSLIKFSEFYDRFLEWLPPEEVHNYSRIRVGRELPKCFAYGRNPQEASKHYIANISWSEPTNGINKENIEVRDGKLLIYNK